MELLLSRLTKDCKKFPDKGPKAEFVLLELLNIDQAIVDEFNFVLIDTFSSFRWFSKERPEYVDKL